MPALLVLNYDVHDVDALAKYREEAADVILAGTAQLVTSTDATLHLPEVPNPGGTHTVVLTYRSTVEAQRRYASREYQSLLSARLRATTPRAAFIVDVTNPDAFAAYFGPSLERLQGARTRLAMEREQDRRRLRQELHDDLGSLLAGVALTLQAATNAASSDATSSRLAVEEAREQITAAIEHVRRLTRDLRPPAVDDLGLVAALRQLGDRATFADRLHIVVVPSDADPTQLPAGVEVALYRIVRETLDWAADSVADGAVVENAQIELVLDNAAASVTITVVYSGATAVADRHHSRLRAASDIAEEVGGRLDVMTARPDRPIATAVLPLPLES